MKLNPTKCAFGALIEKLSGFIASKNGIKINHIKIKIIRNMSIPKILKDVKSFLEKINFINWFITLFTFICEPLLKLIKNNAPMDSYEDCEQVLIRSRTTS